MKIPLIVALCVISLGLCQAESTINPTNRHAYGANIGWTDWRADGTNGVVIGDYVCSGSIYSVLFSKWRRAGFSAALNCSSSWR